uniref:Uncharacterized protein n=1 Tax=Streptomyces sp. WT6 TaxID=1486372 RepID=A0A023PYQ9_9ACTN|nr:hypothetical protein wt6.16c [Streptomyces sp. WT6]
MTGSRKSDHLRLVFARHIPFATDAPCSVYCRRATSHPLADRHVLHHALSGTDRSRADLTTEHAEWKWPTLLHIKPTTGDRKMRGAINRDLAAAAWKTRLPRATGSMITYLKDASAARTLTTQLHYHPHGFTRTSLNAHASSEEAHRVAGLLTATALQIHLSTVRQTVSPESDRSFELWPPAIEAITAASEVPVIKAYRHTVGQPQGRRRGRSRRHQLRHHRELPPRGIRPCLPRLVGTYPSGPPRRPTPRPASARVRRNPPPPRRGAQHLSRRAPELSACSCPSCSPTALRFWNDALRRCLDQITALMDLFVVPSPAALIDCDLVQPGALYVLAQQRRPLDHARP